MSAAREPDQADFDLDRFIDMFDEALTSKDPRVIETLRSLMMVVTLTRPETHNVMTDRNLGPLRRLREDVRDLNRRLYDLESEFRNRHYREQEKAWDDGGKYPNEKYALASAQNLAQQVDQNIINQLKLAAQTKGLNKI